MKSKKKIGLDYEKKVIKVLEKYTSYCDVTGTINSGTMWFDKEDLKATKDEVGYLIQVKGTSKVNYRISSDDIKDLWENAYDGGRLPLFIVLFEQNKQYSIILLKIRLIPTDILNYKKSFNFKLNELIDFDYTFVQHGKKTFKITLEKLINVNK